MTHLNVCRSLARRRGREVTPRARDTPTMSLDGSLYSRSRTGSPCPSPGKLSLSCHKAVTAFMLQSVSLVKL